MTIFQTIILGIVQGITEFFPVSSSGHLIAIRHIFNFGSASEAYWLTFDIALHFGTFLAICIFFFKDFVVMIKEGFKFKNKEGKVSFKNLSQQGRLLWYIGLACVPGALAGILFDDIIESYIRQPWIVAISMAVMGVIMYVVDKYSKKEYRLDKITFKQSIFIGIGQMLALIPGFSRSGTTMTVARGLKMDRESAAKFSFLLGAPIMFGAAAMALKNISSDMLNIQFLLGVVVSFGVGLIAIKALMNIVKNIGFGIFAGYRILLAAIILLTYIVR